MISKSLNKPHAEGKLLHPNNLHNFAYDFSALLTAYPPLALHIKKNPSDEDTINFSDSKAVKALNASLLTYHYGIIDWDIPKGYLCPPIPGRVDYLHYVADLLPSNDPLSIDHQAVKMLDIGTGANGIYALLASKIYGWEVTASDIDPVALKNVSRILENNPDLTDRVTLKLQPNKQFIFKHIIQPNEFFTISVCNPPFHASLEEALKGNERKRKNLAINRQKNTNKLMQVSSPKLNFGGQESELWCEGGEAAFLRSMITESKIYRSQCRWFTCLISKQTNVNPAVQHLRKLQANQIKVIDMQQGNKVTRILAWSYLG
jgi:23S rRNA (adenine1618-N6)-methyltransferase